MYFLVALTEDTITHCSAKSNLLRVMAEGSENLLSFDFV
jgi:hypothetical protein